MVRLLTWSVITLVVLVVGLVVATPWLVRAAVPEAFARFGLEASAGGGRFNPLRAEITVERFTLGDPAAPAITLDELGIGVGLRALASGRLELKRLRVKGVDANTDRLVSMWKRVGADTKSGSGGMPIELDDVELVDVRLASVGERIGHDVRIAKLGVTDPVGLATKGKSHVALRGTVAAGSVNLDVDLTFDGDTLEGTGTYRVDKVPLRGWAGLGDAGKDPLTAGSVSGSGDVHVKFEPAHDALGLILDGPVRVDGLGLVVAPVNAEHGDASWKGRLALRWSPSMPAPGVRGDGTLEVEAVHIAEIATGRNPIRMDVTDVSWHGDFDWTDTFMMQAGIVGTRLEVGDAPARQPAWQARAESFSLRMRAEPRDGGGTALIVDDLDLSQLSGRIGDGDAPMQLTLVKLAIDRLHTTRSGGLVLGVAGADSVALAAPRGAGETESRKIEVHALTVRGLTGNTDGALRAANVGAESAEYADAHAGRTLRAEGVDLAGIGLGATGLMGADRVRVASARVREPSVDVWVSEVEAERLHGDGSGRFGAGRVTVARMFQSPTAGISWQASGLAVDGIEGGVGAATRITKVELPTLSLGVDDASWDVSGLYATDLNVTPPDHIDVVRLGFDSLERRQVSSGELQVKRLEGKALRIDDLRAALGSVTSAAIEYRWPGGLHLSAEGIASHGLSGDRSSGVTVERLTVARGAGRAVDGTRLAATALATRGLSLAVDGGSAVDGAELAKLSGVLPDSTSLAVEGVKVDSLKRAAGGEISAHRAALDDARLARRDGSTWTFARLAAGGLGWQSGSGIGVDEASLDSITQTRGDERRLLGRHMRLRNLAYVSPADTTVARLTAGSLEGSAGTAAWSADSIDVKGFEKRPGAGEKIDLFGIGKIEVSDSGNGARMSIENARARTFEVSEIEELSASTLNVDALRIASEKADWPSRLTLSGLRVDKASLRSGNVVDVHEIVARQPYLIVAQSSDNAWMWPPVPGAGGARRAGSGGGIDLRIGRFSTRGPGRVVYIDRATEPAFQFSLDPVVVAIENLDTRLPGGKARFRARGTGNRLSDVRASGALTRRVGAFDLALELEVAGAYVPDFNPYVQRREPLVVSTGWSNLEGDIGIENHRLDGKMSVVLSGLEVRFKDRVPLPARLDPENFPIRTALALLKDPNGDIHIDVPLQAQTNRGDFDFMDTFRAAFAHTVTAAGDVAGNVSGKTVEGALRVLEDTVSLLPGIDAERYSPIAFAPGSDSIAATSLVYLGQLAERLHAHPALEIALCGRAVPTDTKALDSADKASSIDELYGQAVEGVYHVYGASHEGLTALARSRAGAVRRHLRDLHGVANRRLAACEPEVETSRGKPRVDLHVKTPARKRGLLDFL